MDGPSTVEQVYLLFRYLKEGPPGAIPIQKDNRSLGILQAVNWEDAGDHAALERMVRWHESAFAWIGESFPVTPASVRRWLLEQVLPAPDRLLFWVKDLRGSFVGHLGLTHLHFDTRSVCIGDLVAATPAAEVLVAQAMTTLAHWTEESLGLVVRPLDSRHAA